MKKCVYTWCSSGEVSNGFRHDKTPQIFIFNNLDTDCAEYYCEWILISPELQENW